MMDVEKSPERIKNSFQDRHVTNTA